MRVPLNAFKPDFFILTLMICDLKVFPFFTQSILEGLKAELSKADGVY